MYVLLTRYKIWIKNYISILALPVLSWTYGKLSSVCLNYKIKSVILDSLEYSQN